ncbi:MAG: beta-galactosidase [Candidatus Zhuqueibacterota bacterium]
MTKIALHKNNLLIGSESLPLISGEMHYWRLQPYYWEKCLHRIREMGLDIIATYVCWDFHEHEEDTCDFNGATLPERNLVEFLSLCHKMDFKVILRPGPYIYSEWPQAGVPARIAPFHRLHPKFLDAAGEYIRQLTQAILPFLFTSGGPIILLQADNEIDPFVRNYGEQLGVYGGAGLFQDFLQEKYTSIDALNQAWHGSLSQFSEAMGTIRVRRNDPSEKIRAIDFQEFQFWCAKKIARWAVETYRAAGVDIPIYLNTILNCISQNLREMDQEFPLVGVDLYPSNEFHESEDEHLSFFRNLSYASAVTRLPYIPEFECGIWHNYSYHTGSLSPNHYRLTCLTALIAGVVGWNWYMVVERDNWYFSPINARGYKRFELFDPLKKIVEVFKHIRPAELNKLSRTAITEDESHFFSEQMGGKNMVARAVYKSGISFRSYDIMKGDETTELLFYCGPEWMSQERQERLVRFVTEGGNAVFFNTFPWLDETMLPCSILRFPKPDGSTPTKDFQLTLGEEHLFIHDAVSIFRDVPGEAIYATQSPAGHSHFLAEENELHENLELGKKFIIGYRQVLEKGALIFLGCSATAEIIAALHRWLKAPIMCRAMTDDVHAALFQRDENEYVLIAVNNGNEQKSARISLAASLFSGKNWAIQNPFQEASEQVAFSAEPMIILNLNKKDGTVLELTRHTS